MDNNEIYVSEVIESYLDSQEEMVELDRVTVNSLFRTCIEVINPELPRSSAIIRDIRNPEKSHSIKLKNLKLNLNFALEMILGIGGLWDAKKGLMIFQVLDIIRKFFSCMDVTIEKEDAYLLYLIYNLDYKGEGVTKDNIMQRIKTEGIIKEKGYFKAEGDLEKSIHRLLDLQSIIELNGGYHVRETILN